VDVALGSSHIFGVPLYYYCNGRAVLLALTELLVTYVLRHGVIKNDLHRQSTRQLIVRILIGVIKLSCNLLLLHTAPTIVTDSQRFQLKGQLFKNLTIPAVLSLKCLTRI